MKWLAIAIVIAILVVPAFAPAFADRSEDLQKRYAELVQERLKINEELLRIEGAFSELQRIEAETKARGEAEKFEQQIIKTEAADKTE